MFDTLSTTAEIFTQEDSSTNFSFSTGETIYLHSDEAQAWELEEVLKDKFRKPGDLIYFSLGRMTLDKDDSPIQITREVHLAKGTLADIHDLIKSRMGRGKKHEAFIIYPSMCKVRGSSTKDNCAGVQLLGLDLDGTITCEEDFQRLLRFLRNYDFILYSTASHDPANGKWRLRVFLVYSMTLSYGEAKHCAKEFCRMLGDFLGTHEGIDACSERAFQPMLITQWPTKEIKDQSILLMSEGGGPVPVDHMLKKFLKIQEEEIQEERSRQLAVNFISPPVGEGSVDKRAKALEELLQHPCPAGHGLSYGALYKSCIIARDWGLEQEDAVALLEAVYIPQGQSKTDIASRTEWAYSKNPASRGWRLRAAQAQVEIDLEEVFTTLPHASLLKRRTLESGSSVSLTTEPPTPPKASSRLTKIHEKYLPTLSDFRDLPAAVEYVKSAWGTGKNTRLQPAFELAASRGERTIALSHRVSLSRGHEGDFGIPNYQDVDGVIEGSIAIVLDSLERVALYETGEELELVEKELQTLLFDESEQLGRHLFAETIRGRGKVGPIFNRLSALVKSAKYVIAQDADLGPFTIFMIRLLKGWKLPSQHSEHMTLNTYQPTHLSITMYKEDVEYWAAFTKAVLARSRGEGPAVWEYNTSKEECKAHDKKLKRLFPTLRTLVFHADSTGEPEQKRLLSHPRWKDDPTLTVEQNLAAKHAADPWKDYDVILATPSVGTGVSVDTMNHFQVFGFLRSGTGPLAMDCCQGLSRVRNPIGSHWTVFCGGEVKYQKENAEEVFADLHYLHEDTTKQLEGIDWDQKLEIETGRVAISVNNNDVLRLNSEVLAMQGKYGNHLHDIVTSDANGKEVIKEGAFPLLLKRSGISFSYAGEILDEIEKKEIKGELRAVKIEVREEFEEMIFKAPEISVEEAQELQTKDATLANKAMISKAYIEDFYGNTSKETIHQDDQGRYREKLKKFARVHALNQGEIQAIKRLDLLAYAEGYSSCCKHLTQQAQSIQELWALFGIKDFAKDSMDGTLLQMPTSIPKELKVKARRVLGKTITKDMEAKPIYLARSLAQMLGLKLSSSRKEDPTTGKTQAREYSLDAEAFQKALQESSRYFARVVDPKGEKARREAYLAAKGCNAQASAIEKMSDDDFLKLILGEEDPN